MPARNKTNKKASNLSSLPQTTKSTETVSREAMGTSETPVTALRKESSSSLSSEQTKKALSALISHIEKKAAEEAATADANPGSKKRKLNLLSDDPSDPKESEKQALYLVIASKKYFSDKPVMKPHRIAVPHPIYNVDNTSICLITKDPQRLYKDILLVDENSPVKDKIARIVGVSKLKTKFKTFEAKRQLRDEHDLFLADDRVVPLMPELLGKTFISVKKMPVPISILNSAGASALDTASKVAKARAGSKRYSKISPEEELALENAAVSSKRVNAEITRTLNSAMVFVPAGTTTTVKVGFSTFAVDDLAENIQALIDGIISKNIVKGGWDGIRSLHLKTRDSISLPIYLTEKLT
ncbi:ribosomal protein L1/ribosomal biogenesis protein [Lipomyces kononenkoae]|uniref:Ribosomal protein L1/ribosomal biogenesis protein n=1 Tax=Lipomyces kononenkoae TaxID=34357 RepID=A0ACC3T5S3_LIPKO